MDTGESLPPGPVIARRQEKITRKTADPRGREIRKRKSDKIKSGREREEEVKSEETMRARLETPEEI